jgi:cell division septal protein FtsQ
MTAVSTKPIPRSELVRRRRLQQTKRRYEAVTQAARTVRPLVSRPRHTGTAAVVRRGFSARSLIPRVRLPSLPHVTVSWRLASLSLVVLLGAMLIRLIVDPAMYLNRGINLGGAALVPGEEIYRASGVAGQHIFWVDPVKVQQNVLSVPGVASATVTVEWPSTVTIIVRERIPVVKWVEGEREWWVDAEGQKFKARGDLPGLIPITVDDVRDNVRSYQAVPVEAIAGALQLRELRPNIELLHYDTLDGLSYQDGRNWRGYFGVGANMAQKLAVYETLVDNLLSRGIQPALISVENVKAPYYRK